MVGRVQAALSGSRAHRQSVVACSDYGEEHLTTECMHTMTKNAKDAEKQTRRTQVKDLPKPEKELSEDEQKKVKGGVFGFEPQPIAAEANRK